MSPTYLFLAVMLNLVVFGTSSPFADFFGEIIKKKKHNYFWDSSTIHNFDLDLRLIFLFLILSPCFPPILSIPVFASQFTFITMIAEDLPAISAKKQK